MKNLNRENVVLSLWKILLGIGICMLFYPEGRRLVSSVLLLLVLGSIYVGTIILYWKRRLIRFSILSITLLLVLFLLLPGRAADPIKLRASFLERLQEFEGVKYHLGSEHSRGIDCSGLLRRGLIDAYIKNGLACFNPHLVREGIYIYFNDLVAKTLLDGYRGRTRFITTAPSINKLDHLRIVPGDFAVTSDGRHVLIYLGNVTWIEADPTFQPKPGLALMKVVRLKVPVTDNPWFNTPVKLVRWLEFDLKNPDVTTK